jgi:hypothetical protein
MVGTALRAFAHPTVNYKEVMMRALAGLAFTLAMTLAAASAQAQAYDPNFPVCLQTYGRDGNFITCAYGSIEQCRASASGRAATCMVNPYFAGRERPPRRYRPGG